MGGFFFGGKGDLGLLVIYVPFFVFWFRRIVTDSISSAAKGRPSQARRIVRTVKPRVFIYKLNRAFDLATIEVSSAAPMESKCRINPAYCQRGVG